MRAHRLDRTSCAVAGLVALAAVVAADGAYARESDDIRCLALTIYHEARGEPEAGKLAVGHVVMNRTRSAGFPSDVCGVVKQGGERRNRCQFSWWCDGRSDRPRDATALRHSLSLAEAIYRGCMPDPTRGALWFHTTAVTPAWSRSSGAGKRIGRHVFYRGAPGIETASANLRWRASRPHGPTACAAPPPRRRLIASSGS